MNKGRIFLNNISEADKQLIISKYGSLDDFYTQLYYLGMQHRLHFGKEEQFMLEEKMEVVKSELEALGIDFLVADSIVEEITLDYAESKFEEEMIVMWGENWQSKIEALSKMYGI